MPTMTPFLGVALIAALAALMPSSTTATLYEGSPCFHEASQLRGVCKLLPYCSWAVKERRSGLYPQTCSFDGFMPVVCCPYTRNHDPPHLPLRPEVGQWDLEVLHAVRNAKAGVPAEEEAEEETTAAIEGEGESPGGTD